LQSAIWVGLLPPDLKPVFRLPAIMALLLGLFGLLVAGDWKRGGAGRRPAQIGIGLGLVLGFL